MCVQLLQLPRPLPQVHPQPRARRARRGALPVQHHPARVPLVPPPREAPPGPRHGPGIGDVPRRAALGAAAAPQGGAPGVPALLHGQPRRGRGHPERRAPRRGLHGRAQHPRGHRVHPGGGRGDQAVGSHRERGPVHGPAARRAALHRGTGSRGIRWPRRRGRPGGEPPRGAVRRAPGCLGCPGRHCARPRLRAGVRRSRPPWAEPAADDHRRVLAPRGGRLHSAVLRGGPAQPGLLRRPRRLARGRAAHLRRGERPRGGLRSRPAAL
mmetsp:Transcript_13222/g.44823  ORF Transcript_13222/g.44823 Transcript_13222/m.44823 type:complete len:268 (+) Transcript_13222:607-1410(+)